MFWATLGYYFFILLVGVISYLVSRSVLFTIFIIATLFLIGFIALYKNVIKPIEVLSKAISEIDLEKDEINTDDFNKLRLDGISEISILHSKFRLLFGIIEEKVNKVNREKYKSEHDGLTGLYNRTKLNQMKAKYESKDSFSVIFIDINNLKMMNDNFGHDAGDALIKHAAEKIKFWSKFGDVYRIGGDEFLVVVTDFDRGYVINLFTQWYPTVGRLNRESDGFACLLSYGYSYGKKGDVFDKHMKIADEAMYNMKVKIKESLGEAVR